MNLDLILFFVLAVVAVASALAMLLTRNPVYSAVFLVLNFSTIAVFYLLLSAPFIALVQIAVYAGAIMVLFLFVIMLLGAQETRRENVLPWQQPLALVLGLVLLAEIVFLIFSRGPAVITAAAPVAGFGTPEQIGRVLFTDYVLPFEITGILLLVAMIGAILIAQKERAQRRRAIWGREAAEGRLSQGPKANGNGSGARIYEGDRPPAAPTDQTRPENPSERAKN
jgi:NADH-quinone oxidoreductase subunit J